jgi:hypothetical protein
MHPQQESQGVHNPLYPPYLKGDVGVESPYLRGDVQGKNPNFKTELVEKLNHYFVGVKLIQRG